MLATFAPLSGFLLHLPILQVIIPLITAPIVVVIGIARIGWLLAFLASIASLVVSYLLLMQVIDGSVISYQIGGWAPPLGIEYRVDAANAFVLLILSVISTVVLPYAKTSVEKEIRAGSQTLFYTAYLLCFTGLLGVVITGDAFNVFVFLEISSLSTYVLVAMGAERDKRALTAAFDYLVMGTIGATFFVIGIGLLYMMTGTLNIVDLASRLEPLSGNRTVQAAFAFIVVGIGLKLAIYPLHLWLPNAYTYAPSAVTSFLAATATKVAIYVLLRFMFSVFAPEFSLASGALQYIILPFGVIAMFAASIVAVFQADLKRTLAYSSVAQIGYMLLGIGYFSNTGLSATMIQLFNHAVTKAALFMAVGALVYRTGTSFIPKLAGLGRQMPWTSAAIVAGGLSLIGIPTTVGFISKWVLLTGALEKDWWWMAILIVASSLIAVIYIWQVVEVLYLKEPENETVVKEAPLSMLLPIWTLIIASFYFGLDTELTLTSARAAADAFIGAVSPIAGASQ